MSNLRVRYFLGYYLGGSAAFGGILGFCLGYRQLRYYYQNSPCFQDNSFMIYLKSIKVIGESIFTGCVASILSSLLLHIPTIIYFRHYFVKKKVKDI